jgi:iron complex outermembrane recepter protein
MHERLHRPAAAGSLALSFALVSFALVSFALVSAATAAAFTDAATDTVPVPVHHEEGVVVTASRYGTDVHLSHSDLTGSELRRRQSASELPLLLQDLPGVFAYSDAGSGLGYTYLKIRGFDQRRVAVLINGVPQNDPEDHQVYWVNLPDLGSSLEDVQVQRGVTNSVGGVAAIGGTVNLVTELLGDEPRGRAAFEVGSFGTSRTMLSYQTGELGQGFATGLRISQQRSDGFRERSGTDQWAVFWTGRWRNDAHQVQANVFTGHELTQHAWLPAPASILAQNRRYNPETYWNAVDDFRQPQYQLHWEWDLRANLQLRQSFYHIHGEGFYENFRARRRAEMFSLDAAFPERYAADDRVDLIRTKWVRKDQTGWAPTLRWEHPGGRLLIGGDGYVFHGSHWGEVLQAGPGSGGAGLRPDDIPDGLQYYDYSGDKRAWSIYANERWEFVRGLTLLADVQYQHRYFDFRHGEVGNFVGPDRHAFTVSHDFFNPKGGLFWQTPWAVAGGQVGLYAHAGITHREPSDSDLWGAFAGPDDLGVSPLFAASELITDPQGTPVYTRWRGSLIEPEKVYNYEAGLAWRGRRLSATVNGYWMDFRNEIVPTGYWDDERGTLRTNAEKTLHRGLELGLRWQPHPDHRLTVGASRSWNEYDRFRFIAPDGSVEDYSGNPIALFPGSLVSATWSSRQGPLAADLRLRYLGRQYLDNTGDRARTIVPSTVLDLALFYDLGRAGVAALSGLEVTLRVQNLLDEDYETSGYHDEWDYGENMYIPGASRSVSGGVTYSF